MFYGILYSATRTSTYLEIFMSNRFALIRVLVVDDDETQLALMVAYLQKLGVVHYVTAGDGEEALKLLLDSEHNFHIVFTDNDMPVMDGQRLIFEIRSRSTLDHVKLVMTTDNLTDQANPLPSEVSLRAFLQETHVLGIRKDDINTSVLGQTMEELTEV